MNFERGLSKGLLLLALTLVMLLGKVERSTAQTIELPEQCDCDTAYVAMDSLLVIGEDTINFKSIFDSLETVTSLECQDSFLLYTAEDGIVDTINLKSKIDSFETLTIFGALGDTSLFYVDEDGDTTKTPLPLEDADFFNFRTNMPPTDITDTIYTLNNVGIGTPIPLGMLHVNTDDSRDAVFSRFNNDPTNDMDLDIVRGFGSTALPMTVTSDGIRLGGVRYRTFVNPLAPEPLDAFGISGEVAAETDGVPSPTSSPGQVIIGTTPQGELRPVDRITIRQSGLVGINESDPTNRLHVVDTLDPLRLEGVQNQPTDSILFITGEGVVKYGSVDSFDTTNDAWINLPDSQRIELSTLSDGTTPRTDATSRFYVRDDGKLVYGDDLSTGIGGENDNSGFFNIRRNTGFASLKLMATEGQATYAVESYNDGQNDASTLRFFRGRGVDSDDFSTQVNVQENDRIGQIEFQGYNNNTARPAERMSSIAAIRVEVDGPVIDDNNGIPGRISFHTTGGGAFPNRRMVIKNNGFVGIGTAAPSERLEVNNGNILVTGGSFFDDGVMITPDYVFQKYFDGFSSLNEKYEMMSLQEIEEFVREHKHLPGVQSHEEAKENGWNLSRANRDNLEKIEELYLHTIELSKEVKQQNEEIQAKDQQIKEMKDMIEALLKRVEALESK